MWYFPKTIFVANDAADPTVLTQTFVEVEDALWALDAHNFTKHAVVDRADMTEGAGATLRSDYVDCDLGMVYHTPGPGVDPPRTIAGIPEGIRSYGDSSWREVATRYVETTTCSLYILFSWQQLISKPAGMTHLLDTTKRRGVQYAIRVNGVILNETIMGASNAQNDQKGEGFGGEGMCQPFLIDVTCPVQAGQQMISLIWRQTKGDDFSVMADDDYYMIGSREFFVLEG